MKRYRVLWVKVFLATLILLSSALSSSYATAQERNRRGPEEIWRSEPKYYEPSGSYFQLVRDSRLRNSGVMWSEAAEDASKLIYKGRPGRLAIIEDGALYGWILENFKLLGLAHAGNTWIGLRYMCGSRTLMRVSGEEQPRSAFSFWDFPWYRDEGIRCGKGNLPYMGVFINGETSRWRAAGDRKGYPHYLVEYPAK